MDRDIWRQIAEAAKFFWKIIKTEKGKKTCSGGRKRDGMYINYLFLINNVYYVKIVKIVVYVYEKQFEINIVRKNTVKKF